VFYGNSLESLLTSLVISVVLFFVLIALKKPIIALFSSFAKKTENDTDDFIVGMFEKMSRLFFGVVAIYVGLKILVLPSWLDKTVNALFIAVVFWQVAIFAKDLANFMLDKYIRKSRSIEDGAEVGNMMTPVRFVINFLIWALALLLILDNMGVDVTSLIAGLGIGGIAVALAVQNILGDLFASMSIVLDKPFVVGDFIVVGDKRGVVENIGIKTTRIKALDGEQVVISNSNLLSSIVHNYKKMQERRVAFSFGIVYESSLENIKAIPGIIKEIVEKQEGGRFDRAHFARYGDSSLDFDVVYFINSGDYTVFMNIQQAINLEMFERFAAMGVEFAYATRTIYTKSLS